MNEFRINSKLMGSAFELVIVESDADKAEELLEMGLTEIRRIEALLTEFKDDSVTTEINANAGRKAVTVPDEVFALIERCMRLSALTKGAFDITVGPLKRLYNFKNAEATFPSAASIQNCLAMVGHWKIQLDATRKTVYLPQEGMKIGFAAIGKGYAADCVKRIWQAQGVAAGVVNASGDLSTFGRRADGSHWRVGIVNPDCRAETLMYVPLDNGAVATSGDYEQYFLKDGQRFSHNINPKSGLPLQGIKSVTLFAPSAELADALATAVYVMGGDAGIHFVNQLPHTHCIVINDKNETFFSQKMDLKHEV